VEMLGRSLIYLSGQTPIALQTVVSGAEVSPPPPLQSHLSIYTSRVVLTLPPGQKLYLYT